jgi:transposase InsO family protein
MKYEFIFSHRSALRVEKMCLALRVSRSGYYDWLNRGQSQRDRSNQVLLEQIERVYRDSRGNYGSPRITAELRADGEGCNKKRVARLMRINGIAAKTKRRFKVTTNSKHNQPVAANLVNQQFVAGATNKLWSSDITYIWTKEGWLYLSVVLDVYSRRIVGWSMNRRLTKELVIEAVNQALSYRNPGRNMIFHSDQGSQYASNRFRKLLADNEIKASMSGKGNCYDNAITETFFHTLKTELVYFENYQTREEAKLSIFEYIEVFYNRKRRHSAIGYQNPVDFENQKT